MTINLSDLLTKNHPFLRKMQDLQEQYCLSGGNDIISYTTIPTGFTDLDKVCGLEEHGINVIASRPAMGKTSLAIDIALNIASKKQQGNLDRVNTVQYLSFESTSENFLQRLITKKAEVETDKIRKGCFNAVEFQNIVQTVSKLQGLDFKILKELPKNEDAVLEFIDLNCQAGDVVFIDYIDLIINNFRSEPYVSGVDFVRRLKLLGIEKKVTFVILSQLLKKIEDRAGHRPMISDLPYGVLANHADNIMLLLRREYYDPMDKPGMADMIIAKARNVAIGNSGCFNIRLSFNKEYAKFSDYSIPNYQGLDLEFSQLGCNS